MLAKSIGFALLAVLLLVVLAALGLFAKLLMTFFALLLVVALIPLLVAVYAKLKLQAKKREDVDRSRGSVLKHVWEEQQHREW
jgi:O-antigen ligase